MFERFGKEMQTIQKKQAEENKQAVQRGFHAKHHGCLQGRLRILPSRDPRTRFGIFAGPRADFPIWARFSNGVGWRQKDGDLDARGIAVKVMEIEGPKLIDAEEKTQDFLMTNSPVPIGRNAVHFMRFARAKRSGFLVGDMVCGDSSGVRLTRRQSYEHHR
jgi:catalase